MIWFLLAIIGLLVGAFGTLIGAAGGFLLVPILLFLYPQASPSTITSITLTVAFFNALSGSIAYGRLKRIDYRSGLLFSLAGVPGAVIGASITSMLNRDVFQFIFGITLIIVAAYLLVKPERHQAADITKIGQTKRTIVHRDGTVSTYSFNLVAGIAISFGVGLIGGLLGIGGGILHVPALTQVLGFPAHVATATSQFVVAITTLSAVTVHIISGAFTEGYRRAAVLSVGAIIGAQFGARLSHNVSEVWIVRLLAIGLALVAIRLLIAPF
ncbi:MAG: sulfite exporter TauE/SafE family protein [Dehalococcoidales bacterium]|nr:sulfite exporter TauE/SafE family protein [Dehalococcoidales bacterium]